METESVSFFSVLLSLGMWAVAAGVVFGLVLIPMIFRKVVEPNEVHIVQSRKKTRSYGKEMPSGNAYYNWPSWIPVIGVQVVILPLSIFAIELKDYDAYDVGKVPFVVDVWAFFQIKDSNTAATRVASFAELKVQIEIILQGATRTILAKSEIEDIMEERSIYGERFTQEVEKHLEAWGVQNTKSIELMDIRDPVDGSSKTIADIMARKKSEIDKQSRIVVAGNKKEAQVAEIDAQREVDVQAQAARQTVGERTAKANQQIGVANEISQQEIKEEARKTMTKEKAVQQVDRVRDAEIAREVIVVEADQDKQQTIINSEASKAQDVITAEGEKQQLVLKAEGHKEAEVLRSTAILAVGSKEATVIEQKEIATVQGQITLAEVIGENEGYQTYLVRVRDIEKGENVGIANAKAYEDADIRIIANSGDAEGGLDDISQLLSSSGGQKLGALAEGFAQTPVGEALLKAVGVARPNGPDLEDRAA